jgi:hypothetical protein
MRTFPPSFASHRPTGEADPAPQLAAKQAIATSANAKSFCMNAPKTEKRAVDANARYERRLPAIAMP